MNYQDMIREWTKRGSVPGLDTIKGLMEDLGNPQDNLAVIHVAGTNGKGSVCTFLASLLMEAGLSVGRYLSPTIQCYEERFQINGVFISPEELGPIYEKIWETDREPTIFEAETAAAFCWFAQKKVDLVILECGMGGLLDATNVIRKPLLSIITSISRDHMSFLGDSLAEIAAQKAGIIKDACPVVLGENPPEVVEVIRAEAERKSAPLRVLDREDYVILEEREDGNVFEYHGVDYQIYLPGAHQISNAVIALAAGEVLAESLSLKEGIHFTGEGGQGERKKSLTQVFQEGLEKTRWPGRLEIIGRDPLIYRDGSHNADGARALASFIEKHFTNRRIIYIMGILSDKEVEKMVKVVLPSAASFYVFTPQNVRGLEASRLAKIIRNLDPDKPVEVCREVNQALKRARKAAGPDDVLVVCGSLSFMEEMECNQYE